MKNRLLFIIFFFSWRQPFAQPSLQRYKDDIFTGSDTLSLNYGNNINYLGQSESLLADYYLPKNDSAQNRAAIIFVHGGGFRNGHRNDAAIVELCDKLARKGYIAVSIDYRVGLDSDSSEDPSAAIVRAIQDLNASIRFTKANAGRLGIDSNHIFISGASAGGITVLCKAFMKIDSSAVKFGVNTPGDLEGSSNQLNNSSKVAAVYALWGAVMDTNWIRKEDIPVGCVHSVADSTIPYISGYNKRNGSSMLYGSYSVIQRAKNTGLITTLHVYNSGKHDLGLKITPYKDTTVQLISDFFYNLLSNPMKEPQSSIQSQKYPNETSSWISQASVCYFSPTYMLNKGYTVQVSDTTGDATGTIADDQNIALSSLACLHYLRYPN